MDLFGDIADEKGVNTIIKNVPEAKSGRTYETYILLGRFISTALLGKVLAPLKEVSFFLININFK